MKTGLKQNLNLLIMDVKKFNLQCIAMLEAARQWPDSVWDELEDSWTMAVMDAMSDLECYMDDESESESTDSAA